MLAINNITPMLGRALCGAARQAARGSIGGSGRVMVVACHASAGARAAALLGAAGVGGGLAAATWPVVCASAGISGGGDATAAADRMYDDSSVSREDLLAYLKRQVEERGGRSASVALRWRLARAMSDVATPLAKSDPRKKELLFGALELVEEALEDDESDFAVHKWMGILYSKVRGGRPVFTGSRSRIRRN